MMYQPTRLRSLLIRLASLFFFASALLSVLAGGHAERLRAQSAASTFVYVTNHGSDSVSAYTVDDSTGILTPVPGSPFATGVHPFGVAADPSGQFLYVANNFVPGPGGGISAYAIDGTTGALTLLSGSPFGTRNSFPRSVAVHPSGRFLYVTSNGSNDVEAFTIDATTGALAPIPGSPFPVGTFLSPVSVDPSGRFLFTAQFGEVPDPQGMVFVASIDPASGALTAAPGSPFMAGSGTDAVNADPSSKFVYAANAYSQDISAYTLDATTGTLTPVLGSPFPSGSSAASPRSISVHPSGRFLYAANFVLGIPYNGNVGAFTIDGTTGGLAPVPGSPFPTGNPTVSGTLDPSGRFFFAVNGYPHNVSNLSAFTVDVATGALTETPGSPFPTEADPFLIAVARVMRP